MKKLLILNLAVLLLAGCSSKTVEPSTSPQKEEEEQGQTIEEEGQEVETPEEEVFDDHIPTNSKVDINPQKNYKFYDGKYPELAEDWSYYYGTSKKANGEGYGGDGDAHLGVGMLLQKKTQYMVSPLFKSYDKVEVNLSMWFCPKTGNNAFHDEGVPQLTIESYSELGKLLLKTNITINPSEKRNDSKCTNKKVNIESSSMSYFIIRYNNTLKVNNAYYAISMHEISLLGTSK